MSGTYKSTLGMRKTIGLLAAEKILEGCEVCGKDAIFLLYTNQGYGEPFWVGYCRDHEINAAKE